MSIPELQLLSLVSESAEESNEEFSIPLDISDIINICREYNNLGWHIQQQVENILEIGVEESIKCGYVKRESLPYIKSFLNSIYNNPYFGDAAIQSKDCIKLIDQYELDNKVKSNLN